MSEQEISQQEDLPKPSRYSTKVFARALIKPVRLPPPPPAPAFPPPALTDADLKIYMKPLIKNGWRICNPRIRHREARMALMGYPSLHRVYRFTDYHAARHFLHTAVAAMPLPTHATLVRRICARTTTG
jgi:hypothetical protein